MYPNDHPAQVHQRQPLPHHQPGYYPQVTAPGNHPQYPPHHAPHVFHPDHELPSANHRIHPQQQRNQDGPNHFHSRTVSPASMNCRGDHFNHPHSSTSQPYYPASVQSHNQQHGHYIVPHASSTQPIPQPSKSNGPPVTLTAASNQSGRNGNPPSNFRHLSTTHVSEPSFYNARDHIHSNRPSLHMQQAPMGSRHYPETSNPTASLPYAALGGISSHANSSENPRTAQNNSQEVTKTSQSLYSGHNAANPNNPNAERNAYNSSFHPSAATSEHERVGRSFSPLRLVAPPTNSQLRRGSTPIRYLNNPLNTDPNEAAPFTHSTNFRNTRLSPAVRHTNGNVLYKYPNRLDDPASMNIHNSSTSAVASRLAAITKSCYLTIASVAESMEDFSRAQLIYEQILERAPRSIEALTKLAAIHRSRDQFEKAIELYERALAIDPTLGEVHGALGYCHLMTDDLERSFQSYQLALNHIQNPSEPKLWYGIGILYERWACFDNAEIAFSTALRNDPNFEKANEVYFRLGVICKQQAKWDDALRWFQHILGNPPPPLNDLDIHLQIGHCYEQQGRHHLAKDAYNLILASDPNHAKAYQQLGWLHHIAGQGALSNNEERADQNRPIANGADNNDDSAAQSIRSTDLKAVELLERAAELDSEDAQTFYLLGRVHMAHRHYNAAHDAYQQAVYRDPRNPSFWCSIGVLYFQIRQYRDALDAYSRAIRINSRLSEVWYDLGTLYEACNNQLHDAMDAYERAASLDPQNVHIRQRLEYVRDVIARGGGGSEENNARIEPLNEGDHDANLPSNPTNLLPPPPQVDVSEPKVGSAASAVPIASSNREYSRVASNPNAARHFSEEQQALGRPRASSQSQNITNRLVSQQHPAQNGSPAKRPEVGKEQSPQEVPVDTHQRLPPMNGMVKPREASLPESASAAIGELQPAASERRNDRNLPLRAREQPSAQDRRADQELGIRPAPKRGDTLQRIVEHNPRPLVRGDLDEDYDDDDGEEEAQKVEQQNKNNSEPASPPKAPVETPFREAVRTSSKPVSKKRRANDVGAKGLDGSKPNNVQLKHPGDKDSVEGQYRKRVKS